MKRSLLRLGKMFDMISEMAVSARADSPSDKASDVALAFVFALVFALALALVSPTGGAD